MSQEATKKLRTTIQINGGKAHPSSTELYPRELFIDTLGYLWVGNPREVGDDDTPQKAQSIQKVKAEAAELVVGTEGVLYGSTLPRAADLKEGQVFFLVEE